MIVVDRTTSVVHHTAHVVVRPAARADARVAKMNSGRRTDLFVSLPAVIVPIVPLLVAPVLAIVIMSLLAVPTVYKIVRKF